MFGEPLRIGVEANWGSVASREQYAGLLERLPDRAEVEPERAAGLRVDQRAEIALRDVEMRGGFGGHIAGVERAPGKHVSTAGEVRVEMALEHEDLEAVGRVAKHDDGR